MNQLITLYSLPVLLLAAGYSCLPWILHRKSFKKSQKRITELEKEMLACHSEILELNREIGALRYEAGSISKSNVYPLTAAK